jgi:hypothetical protein
MPNRPSASRHAVLYLGITAFLLACSVDVTNPSLIVTSTIDPLQNATMLTLSAQQSWWSALNRVIWAEGVFSGEAWTTGINVASPDFGRRTMAPLAGNNQAPQWWNPLQAGLAANEGVIALLSGVAGADTSTNLARAYMNSGFEIQHMGESSCQGVITGGPPLTPTETLDTAIVRLKAAIAIGTLNGGIAGDSIAKASNVALAQIYLQLGQYAQAISTAALVPASFTMNAVYLVNLANLSRVSNLVFDASAGSGGTGGNWVTPPMYQALNDPRVPWKDLNKIAYDTVEAVQQLKYANDGSPIRLESGLEASYISAEANLQMNNTAPALALIATRRVVGGQGAFTGSGNAAILAELMDQKARDFWMEGKKMADYQRNPAATPYVSPAGAPFYYSSVSFFGTETCFPMTLNESQANPNFPQP